MTTLSQSARSYQKPSNTVMLPSVMSLAPFQNLRKTVPISDVLNNLRKLKTNKAIGLDKISPRLLKDASDMIVPILTGLINKSFEDEKFPKISGSQQKSSHCLKAVTGHRKSTIDQSQSCQRSVKSSRELLTPSSVAI